MSDLRVTLTSIEARIRSEAYFTAAEGVIGADPESPVEIDPELKLVTICVLILDNGFKVVGISCCVDPENFNAEIGKNIARDDAIRQIWPLLGFELKTLSSTNPAGKVQASALAKRGEAERQAKGHDAVGTGPAEQMLSNHLDTLPPHIGVSHVHDTTANREQPFGDEA